MGNGVYCDKNLRYIYLGDDVNNLSIGEANDFLLSMVKYDDSMELLEKDFQRKPISIYVNSRGGSVDDMWSLVDLIDTSKTPVFTYCTGYAFSSGLLIFLAGKRRFGSRHSVYGYHQIYTTRSDCYQGLIEDIQQTSKEFSLWEDYVLEKTKLSRESLKEIREKRQNRYFDLDEAIDLGIVTDKI